MDYVQQLLAFPRSPKWAARQKLHLKTQPKCLVCGRDDVPRNVHHKYPFSYIVGLGREDLELDARNLYTLCTSSLDQAHILIGHLDSYESYNPRLEHFIALCRGLLSPQIRGMREWVEAVESRPKPYNHMSETEKTQLRKELDKYLPKK